MEPEFTALHLFAHSDNALDELIAAKVIGELGQMHVSNGSMSVRRVIQLHQGLHILRTHIDGWDLPYQYLIPFLWAGCIKLEENEKLHFTEQRSVDFVTEEAIEEARLRVKGDGPWKAWRNWGFVDR